MGVSVSARISLADRIVNRINLIRSVNRSNVS